jgi:hypothetical protein
VRCRRSFPMRLLGAQPRVPAVPGHRGFAVLAACIAVITAALVVSAPGGAGATARGAVHRAALRLASSRISPGTQGTTQVLGVGATRPSRLFALRAGRQAIAAVKAVRRALEACWTPERGYSVCGNPGVLHVHDPSARLLASSTTVVATHDTYTVSVVSRAGVRFVLARAPQGQIARVCDPPGVGGCSRGGTW